MIKSLDNPFKWIEHIKNYKTHHSNFDELSWKNFNIFIINRSLSMYEEYIDIVNKCQKYYKISNVNLYKIYCSKLKNSKRYEQYIKSKSKNDDKQELIDLISKYYSCSNKESKQYLELLTKEDKKNILECLGIDDKQIKKLIK